MEGKKPSEAICGLYGRKETVRFFCDCPMKISALFFENFVWFSQMVNGERNFFWIMPESLKP